MKKIILILIITIIGIVKNPLSAQNVSGKEIMIMVDDRYTGDDKQSEIEMILINKNNKKKNYKYCQLCEGIWQRYKKDNVF